METSSGDGERFARRDQAKPIARLVANGAAMWAGRPIGSSRCLTVTRPLLGRQDPRRAPGTGLHCGVRFEQDIRLLVLGTLEKSTSLPESWAATPWPGTSRCPESPVRVTVADPVSGSNVTCSTPPCAQEALRTWVRQAKADAAGGTPSVLSSAEREELKRPRGEVRELRQANEIVKAASV
jgi:hypothetical protein